MNLKFYKEKNNLWYIDLPEYFGSKDDLEMVMGADTMLDILAQGEDVVYLEANGAYIEDYKIILTSTNDNLADGMTYNSEWSNNISSFDVWLCEVTKFVFGGFPQEIYIK